jgi:hypothetical protein
MVPFVLALTLAQPVPVEPIGAILDAFKTVDVVGLGAGEGHGDVAGPGAFVVSLIEDPRFAVLPIDIVVENANARYQGVMDRYLAGEEVQATELQHVWNDTTQPLAMRATGDIPATYQALREVNRRLPTDRQHRALLGDPPVDWDRVRTPADFRRWLEQRDTNPAEVVRREALAKRRKALVVYGSGHLQRKQQASNYVMDSPLAQTVISLLERDGIKTFIITGIEERDEAKSWPVPSLAIIRGTTIGAEDVPPLGLPRVSVNDDGTFVPIPKERWATMKREDQYDAVLRLAPHVAAEISPAVCTDRSLVEEHLRRIALTGVPQFEVDRVRKLCGLEK